MVKREIQDQVVDEWIEAWFLGCAEAGEGDYGPMLRWRFSIDDDGKTFVRSVLTSDKWGKRAKANKLWRGLVQEKELVGAVDTDKLDGVACAIMYELNDDGKATITKLKPRDDDEVPALSKAAVKALNAAEDERWLEFEKEQDDDGGKPF